MRILVYLRKTFVENLREWKILIITLAFGPFFVYMMYAYFGTTTPSYNLLVLNRDRGADLADGRRLQAGGALLSEWAKIAYPDGKAVFAIAAPASLPAGEKALKNRDADLLLFIPEDFSEVLKNFLEKKSLRLPRLTRSGDHGNARCLVAGSFADYVAFTYISQLTATTLPLDIDFRKISAARSLNDFDLYVPALLVLAIIMVLFTAAASIIKEVDKGTISRLMLSRLSTFEFLSAISINQLLIGSAALALTFLAAVHVGYRSAGSLPLFFAVGALSCVSVIAISLIVAALLKSIFELLTVGVFPFFLLMFFSESMMPLPRWVLFRLSTHNYYVNDLLPTSLTVKAFNKILNFQAGPGDLVFELGGMVFLTLVYFAFGVWLFRRRHMRIH